MCAFVRFLPSALESEEELARTDVNTIKSHTGQKLKDFNEKEFFSFSWRPRPASFLSKEEVEEVSRLFVLLALLALLVLLVLLALLPADVRSIR